MQSQIFLRSQISLAAMFVIERTAQLVLFRSHGVEGGGEWGGARTPGDVLIEAGQAWVTEGEGLARRISSY